MSDELNLNDQNTQNNVGDEDIASVQKKLTDLTRPGSGILQMGKQEIGLLKQMVLSPEQADEFIKIVQICDFLDEDEANRELDAFYEAIRLGMSTEYNIAHALSRASINRRGAHSNSRVAALLDALSHQKFTSNAPKGKDPSVNPRSPIG